MREITFLVVFTSMAWLAGEAGWWVVAVLAGFGAGMEATLLGKDRGWLV